MWRSSFLVNLQACRLIAGNFTIKWTPPQVFFDSILSSPHAPLMFWLKPPLIKFWRAMFATPVGNPGDLAKIFTSDLGSMLPVTGPICVPVIGPTCSSVTLFTSELAKICTGYLANMFTSCQANMFNIELKKWKNMILPSSSIVKLIGEVVCWPYTKNTVFDPFSLFHHKMQGSN